MTSLAESFGELRDSVASLFDIVSDDTEVGRDILSSLERLGSTVADSIGYREYLTEKKQRELLSTLEAWRDALQQQIHVFGETITKEFWEQRRALEKQLSGLSTQQIGAMFASAAMVRNAVNMAAIQQDPQFQAGRRWQLLFHWIVLRHNRDDRMTSGSLSDDLVMNGFSVAQAEVMIRKLQEYHILQSVEDDAGRYLRLDPENPTLKWALVQLNGGNLPMLS